jgi:hypothetical protein
MPLVAEAVPSLLYISLPVFLFFAGLGDSQLSTTVGLSTVVPIGIGGLLYALSLQDMYDANGGRGFTFTVELFPRPHASVIHKCK